MAIELLVFALGLFVSSLFLWSSIKAVRGLRGALSQKLCAQDTAVLAALVPLVILVHALNTDVVTVAVQVALFLYGFLLWLDAVLFVQFRIEVNPQTIRWFFSGSDGVFKGVPHLLKILEIAPVACLIPLCWLICIAQLSGDHPADFAWPTSVLLCAAVAATCKWRLRASAKFLILFSAVGAVCWVLFYFNFKLSSSEITRVIWVPALIALMGFFLLCGNFFSAREEFWTTPTLVTKVFASDELMVNPSTAPGKEHKNHIWPKNRGQVSTEYTGKCRGANVLLITVESLGCYDETYSPDNQKRSYLSPFLDNAWTSRRHFCLCPNTTVATNQLYTGFYSNNPYNREDSLFPGVAPTHIEHLKKNGYRTLFLDTADIDLFNYKRLLERIGFDKIWGSNDLSDKSLKADYRLLEMVDTIADEVKEDPFFLHIINDQTHLPYTVVESEKFNRYQGKSDWERYLNAFEEVDYILSCFLDQLSRKVDMENTIVIVTGDHGESFGDFGYHFHSNSVIFSQLLVPFYLWHANLPKVSIKHSSHFDVFPTLFDLLGVSFDYPTLGASMAAENRDLAYFVHSATLKGNTPANFGFVNDDGLLWIDRLFNRVSRLDFDNQRTMLSLADEREAVSTLYSMLEARGLVSD